MNHHQNINGPHRPGQNQNQNQNPNEPRRPQKPKKTLLYYYTIVMLGVMLFNIFAMPLLNEANSRVEVTTYDKFLDMVDQGQVHVVEVTTDTIYFTPAESAVENLENPDVKVYTTGNMNDPNLVTTLKTAGVSFGRVKDPQPSPIATFLNNWVMPILFFMVIGRLMSTFMTKHMAKNGGMGPGGMMGGMGKSNAKVYEASSTGKTFKDVAGQDEAKEALTEIVDFLNNPGRYKEIGAKMPKGALLVGPPGTGKTLLAKAVAGEAGVPFFSISGSEFVEMFVGMGAARVRDLFDQAEKKAPCIIFIDEIDTIGKKRDSGHGFGGNDEREQTLNQLLTEMDGFDVGKGIVVLAATNRPETLDKALLRPGRFDRRIPVELPDLKGREAILKVHANTVKYDPQIDFDAIARATAGASGAELANIVNEAALRAVRDHRDKVSQADLEESVETVIAGYQRKNAVISSRERNIIAYHEIGHALVAAKNKNTAPVHKITIIPRTSGALGYTMQVEEGEKVLMSKEEAFEKIMTYTGGRAAEELVFKSITSGASNDIEQATKIARAMITRFGMSDTFDMVALETVSGQYLGGDASLACSAETAAQIDREVISMIKDAHQKALTILKENEAKLHELAEFLLEKETITGDEFMQILQAPSKYEALIPESSAVNE
ncbi:MAG: ATP-dependent zinc metalloprotease FtsH [Firmicutes bacterium]|nr:ATP-dependent zinc metalloprotease FtsH [Bacillota bacterium]